MTDMTVLPEKTDSGYIAERNGFIINCNLEKTDDVSVRTDVIENTSDKTLEIYKYAYRFCIESGEVFKAFSA